MISVRFYFHARDRWRATRIFSPLIIRLGRTTRRECSVECVLVNPRAMRQWNFRYRGHDTPTNVLSFGWKQQGKPKGQLLLCPSFIRRECRVRGDDFEQRLRHLFVHGILHIFGYDHQTSSTARTMETLERRILGFDPYSIKQLL